MADKTIIKESDNFAIDYETYRERTNNRQREKRFLNAIDEPDTAFSTQPDLSTNQQTEIVNPDSSNKGIGSTVAKNVIEALPQAAAGPVDTVNEMIGVVDQLGDSLVDLGFPDAIMQFTNPQGQVDIKMLTEAEREAFRLSDEAGLPKVPIKSIIGDPDTTTGKVSREITKFLAGMIPAVRGVKKLAGTAKARTTFTEAAAGSAVAAFVVQDPHEDRLSAFLNEVPFLSALVPDYLADNNPENEGQWEARMKNAVEDAGLGLLTESLVRAFKYYKLARKQKKEAAAENPTDQQVIKDETRDAAIQEADPITREQLAGLGEPDSDKLFIKKKKPSRAKARIKAAEKRVGEAVSIPPKDKDIFINMARIDTPEDVRQLLKEVADADAKAINRKRGGARKKLSEMVTESDAEFLELKDLIGRDPGPMTAAQSLAARKVLTTSGDQLLILAKKANSSGATQADLYAFRRAMAVHYAIQAEVVAARTETARALRSWAIPVGTDKQRGEAITELIQSSGDAKSTKEMAAQIASLEGNPTAINLHTKDLMRAKRFDALYQFWVNNILSGPPTHAVNILSNSLTAVYSIPESMANAAISKVFYDGEISFLESQAKAFGLVKGMRDGVRLVAKGRKAGDVDELAEQFEQFSKIEDLGQNKITADVFGVNPSGKFGYALDYMGRAMNLPTTALRTEDKFFKSIGYRMELEALAIRQGVSEGLEGPALADRIADIVNNPPASLKADAVQMAHYQTFTDPFTSATGKQISQLRQIAGVRYVMPFVRTPGNILSFTFERTPLALASRKIRADIAAGGPRAAQAWGRIMTGSTIMMTLADMTLEGTITGPGPKDERLLKNLKATGWRAFSVKVGDRYFPYNRLDPIGNLVAFGAWFGEMTMNMDQEEQDFAMTAALVHFNDVMASKSYLSGLFNFVGAIDPANPTKTLENFTQNVATGFVPFSSLLNSVVKSIDPTVKITSGALEQADRIPQLSEGADLYLQGVMNRIQSRIPGLSDELPLRRDLWGKEISKASGYGMAFDLLSPIYASLDDPNELEKIIIDNKVPVNHAPQTIFGIRLTPTEYSTFQQISGELLEKNLTKLIHTKGFAKASNGPDGLKSNLIMKQVDTWRGIAKIRMLKEFPRIEKLRSQQMMMRRDALKGDEPQDMSLSAPVIPVAPQEKSNSSLMDKLAGK